MATTLLKLKELSQQTIEAIVKSPDAWKKYLNAAPNIFRYSFEDQLLIYAQAPKATAVATYDVWNKIMHRAVKKGSCGIGLIHTKRRYEKIDYVFDVTQTAEKYDSRSLNIGSFNIRISPKLHKQLVICAMSHDMTLNGYIQEILEKAVVL